jgi:[ribosomal protein S5]-alanine N-acetyltransferase
MKFVLEISSSLVLRPLEISDAANIAKHADNKKIQVNLTDIFPNPYTIGDAYYFIDIQRKIYPPSVFGIIYNGEAIGTIGFNIVDENGKDVGEIGYWIGEAYWNRGIMTQVIDRIITFGFEFYESIDRIDAKVFTYNQASCRVLEKSGFRADPDTTKHIMKAGKEERLICHHIYRNTI